MLEDSVGQNLDRAWLDGYSSCLMGFRMQLLSHIVWDVSLIKALLGWMSKMAHLYGLQFNVGYCLGSHLAGSVN